VPSGALISEVISPIITGRSVRASDRRKAAQEDAMQTRKGKLCDEESLYSAVQEFARAATEILTETIDAKGVFNILPDWYNNRAGRDEPKAMDKLEHGEKVIEAQKGIAVPRRQLLHYGQLDGR
jgi:hypothetical protein